MLSVSQTVASSVRVISEPLIGKDVEGSGSGIIWGTVPASLVTDKNHEIPHFKLVGF
jgi:hypothetical protein